MRVECVTCWWRKQRQSNFNLCWFEMRIYVFLVLEFEQMRMANKFVILSHIYIRKIATIVLVSHWALRTTRPLLFTWYLASFHSTRAYAIVPWTTRQRLFTQRRRFASTLSASPHLLHFPHKGVGELWGFWTRNEHIIANDKQTATIL